MVSIFTNSAEKYQAIVFLFIFIFATKINFAEFQMQINQLPDSLVLLKQVT